MNDLQLPQRIERRHVPRRVDAHADDGRALGLQRRDALDLLLDADQADLLVVEHQLDARQVLALRGLQLSDRHQEAAVAGECHHGPVGKSDTRRGSRRALRPRQVREILFGSSLRLAWGGGKCAATWSPHKSMAATKPSAMRPSRMCATSASMARCHSAWGTRAAMLASAMMRA